MELRWRALPAGSAIKWYRDLKTDSMHKKVMKTLCEFMEDEDLDYMEAAKAAINKRKNLLNRLFERDDLP